MTTNDDLLHEILLPELCLASRILANEGVCDAFGHISFRSPENSETHFLPCSKSPALVEIGDIVEMRHDGSSVREEERALFIERFIHGPIYRARPDVMAVLHAHTHEVIPYSVCNQFLRPVIHVGGVIGNEVRTWDIRDRFGDTSMLVRELAQGEDLAKALGDDMAILMRGHGLVVVGKSIREVVLRAIYLRLNAKIDLAARQLGSADGVRYLSAGEVAMSEENLLAKNPAERNWDYFVRNLN